MNPELKKKLLERLFSSEAYYLEMMEYYTAALNAAKEALNWFEQHQPTTEKPVLDSLHAWKIRVIPNMEGYLSGKEEDIEQYRLGDPDYMEGTAFNVMSLNRNISQNVSEKWWDYVPQELQDAYFDNLYKASKMAANIYRALGGGFAARPGAILDEEITGPVDEQQLLKYLKPGEHA